MRSVVVVSLIATGIFVLAPVAASAGDWEDYQRHNPQAGACGNYVKIALEAMERSEFDKARGAFASAEEKGCSYDGLVLSKMAFIFRLRNNESEAKTYYERAFPLLEQDYPAHPARVHALYNYAYLLEREGQHQRAEDYYRHALAVDPEFQNARSSLKSLKVKLAEKAIERGDGPGAVIQIDEARRLQHELARGTTQNTVAQTAELLLLGVKAHALAGDTTVAKELSAQLLALDAVDRINSLARFWEEREEILLAARCYRRIAEIDSESATPLVALGDLYDRAGESDAAIAAYKEALARKPNHPDLLYSLGVTYYNAGKVQEAIRTFEAVLKINPRHAEAAGALEQLEVYRNR